MPPFTVKPRPIICFDIFCTCFGTDATRPFLTLMYLNRFLFISAKVILNLNETRTHKAYLKSGITWNVAHSFSSNLNSVVGCTMIMCLVLLRIDQRNIGCPYPNYCNLRGLKVVWFQYQGIYHEAVGSQLPKNSPELYTANQKTREPSSSLDGCQ